MKPIVKKLPVLLTTAALVGQLSAPASALEALQSRSYEGDLNISEVFKDQKLQSFLTNSANLGGIGADGVLTEEERLSVTQLDLSGLGLTSLEGLGAFPNLQTMDCSRNSLTALDLSQNPALVRLYCGYNQLQSLDLSANPNLERLNCNFNRIGSLDLTGHHKLISLYCEMNQMGSLTLTGCTSLTTLYCRNNNLDQLLLATNTSLEFIETFDNRLTEIDVSMLPNLRFLHIDHNRLTHLDMSGNTKLEGGGFVARNNFMEEIRLPVQPGLTVYLDDYEEQDPVEGYDRTAWFLDEDRTIPAPKQLEADGQTLYSQRIPNRYTVYFSANGGNGSLSALSAQWDAEAALPENTLQRYGHSFAGWNTQPGGDGTSYEDGARVTNLAGRNTDGDRITLYAQWTPNSYTIRLDPNGGEGEAQTQSAVYGQTLALNANTFSKEGKEFAGWAIEPDGAVRYTDEAQVRSLTAEAGGSVTLYAVWRTPLSELQKPYLAQMDEAFQGYNQGDYTGEDWGVLSGAYAGAVSRIQAAQDTGEMDKAVSAALSAMEAVPTAAGRVEEITASWTAAHRAALALGNLTESGAAQALALTQAALADLAQDQLAGRSGLTSEADRALVVGQAAQSLQTQADRLMTLGQAAQWLESLEGLTTRPMEQVQEEHVADYQNAAGRYEALDEGWKGCIDSSVSAALESRLELAVEKRAEAQSLQDKYGGLDLSLYSARGKASLSAALSSGLSAIRTAGSAQQVRQAGTAAWTAMAQVPTADQEPVSPPAGGGGMGGGGEAAPEEPAGEPSEEPSATVTDEKTGATAQVSTGTDGRVTAQVTIPAGVDHATLRIPCQGQTGTVAVMVLADGTRKVLPRSVYQDGVLAVRLEESATIELVDGSKHFSDVEGGDWFADSVQFTASRELFSGVGGGYFAPGNTMTRSMLVTVLYRLEGSPDLSAGGGFADVPEDAWYSDAAGWAAQLGITSGTAGGRFDPEAPITRESLAVMLYRSAGSPAVSEGGLEDFRDGGQVSDWARDAMLWACESGILTGDGSGGLHPQEDSTRAEVSVMLARYVTLTTLN